MTTRRLLLLAGLAGTMLLAYTPALAQGPVNAVADGTYRIFVRGYYTGDGTATVTGGFVSIDADIRDDSGAKGKLIVTQIGLVGNLFKGTGTLMGGAMTVSGRVEAADPAAAPAGKGNGNQAADAEHVVNDARIAATYKGPLERQGRFAGARVAPPGK
ncbi:MAG TPA: hypothetical protein VIM11_13560 [Tepidisphaeraceae bacterium]